MQRLNFLDNKFGNTGIFFGDTELKLSQIITPYSLLPLPFQK